MRFRTLTLLIVGVFTMTVGESQANPAQNFTLNGPGGIKASFEQGRRGTLAGQPEEVYGVVQVKSPTGLPVKLQLDGYYCDGTDAKDRQGPVHAKGGQVHAQLWSKDGRYVVLQVVPRLQDHTFDFRNMLLTVFDTRSGQTATFRGPTAELTQDTFMYWSGEDGSTALIRGKNGPEQAHAAQ